MNAEPEMVYFSAIQDPDDFRSGVGSGVIFRSGVGSGVIRNEVIRDRLHWLGLDRSKYRPHQGKKECARRLRQKELQRWLHSPHGSGKR